MDNLFSKQEHSDFLVTYRSLLKSLGEAVSLRDIKLVKHYINQSIEEGNYQRDQYELSLPLRNLHTALILSEEIGLRRASVIAVLLSDAVMAGTLSIRELKEKFDHEIAVIVQGLIKTHELYSKNAVIETENYRNLLLSFAEDVRVVIILIASRLYLMRKAKVLDPLQLQKIADEASYLYAPLSHRLGLYKVKSELEDLSLKFKHREQYDFISKKINETKAARDLYIAEFIAPIEKKLNELGLDFDIKGRTKSIFSINNKLQKQQVEFEEIYDLFAIRVILDTPVEKEKSECWQVYSVVTDMYQPNPKRLKDWLSVPKTNGYESLHITVMGPESRWVEVQIRSKRMDEIAERGLAAHWKYKGLKAESGLDEWLNGVREVLENKDTTPIDLARDFKMNLYDEEIYVFTPKGDLYKLPKNASVLDFAFAIHTKIGSKCVSAKINNKNVTIKHRLQSGDQVEIITSPNQTPKLDWLNFTVTSKARSKIKQSLKEQATKQVEFAKELLHRRFKNRKIEEDESILMRVIKKMGYKNVTSFYADIADERLDVNTVIDQYVDLEKREVELEHVDRSVENFHAVTEMEEITQKDDVLIIDEHLTGIEYHLGKCCNPIFGDEVFGYVSTGGIKIHRNTCPNASDLLKNEGKVLRARWSGKSSGKSMVSLKVIGHDDIGIVTNITSIISKENNITLRSIQVNSSDGLFHGTLVVMLSDTSVMNGLIKKIKAVKGVKQVERFY